jgi:hypothetical protein
MSSNDNAATFDRPLIVVYGRDDFPNLAMQMIEVVMPNALVVAPKGITPADLPKFCEEHGGPSLVLFTNEAISGARATDIMLELRHMDINTLLMTDEYTEGHARNLKLCTMPKICSLAEFQIYVQTSIY